MASGKAWEYFIPGWSAVRITQDVINAGKNYIDNRRASNTATTISLTGPSMNRPRAMTATTSMIRHDQAVAMRKAGLT